MTGFVRKKLKIIKSVINSTGIYLYYIMNLHRFIIKCQICIMGFQMSHHVFMVKTRMGDWQKKKKNLNTNHLCYLNTLIILIRKSVINSDWYMSFYVMNLYVFIAYNFKTYIRGFQRSPPCSHGKKRGWVTDFNSYSIHRNTNQLVWLQNIYFICNKWTNTISISFRSA